MDSGYLTAEALRTPSKISKFEFPKSNFLCELRDLCASVVKSSGIFTAEAPFDCTQGRLRTRRGLSFDWIPAKNMRE